MKRNIFIFLLITTLLSVRQSGDAFAQEVYSATKSISNWWQTDTFPGQTRCNVMSCQFATYGLILGGQTWTQGALTGVLSDFWKFDATTNHWTSLPSFGGGKRGSGAMACDGEYAVFAGLGFDGVGNKIAIGGDGYPGNCYNDWWKFDFRTLKWKSVSSLPSTPRYDCGIFTLNGKFYIVGGKTVDGTILSEVWQYDPSTDKWTKKADYPHTTCQTWAFTLNNGVKDYGFAADGVSQSFYKYDDAGNTWSPCSKIGLTALPIAAGVTTVFDEAYVIGGDIAVASPRLRSYDPVADNWTRHADYGYIPAREYQVIWYFNTYIIYAGMGDNFYPYTTYNDMYCFRLNDLDKLYYNNENLIKISNAGLLKDIISDPTTQNGSDLELQNISGGTITIINAGNITGKVGAFDHLARLFWDARTRKWNCYALH